MAKLLGLPKRGKNPTFQKGVTLQVKEGQLIAQKWPKKRGKPRSPVTREQNEWFRQANLLAKYAPGPDQWMAIEVAKGGPMYPRDLMMSAMAGRLYGKIIIDGQGYLPMAVREDVSSDLDFLAGTVEGTIIVKSAGLWLALVPATAGLLLTSNGPNTVPSWQPGAGGGGGFMVTNQPGNAAPAGNFATKGNAFAVVTDVLFTKIGCRIDAVTAHTYQGAVWELDASSKIGTIVSVTSALTGLTAGKQSLLEALDPPMTMVPEKTYCVVWSRTDGADTFKVPIMGSVDPKYFPGLPEEFFGISADINNFIQLAKANPAVGDAVTVSTGGRFHGKFEISV